jgi:hypothetical protein
MRVPLLTSMTDWYCPNCRIALSAPEPPPGQSKFHVCRSLHGLTAPLIRAGVRCKVEAEERQDYLGGEVQATGDDGKPYMAVRTTRDDGCDLAVNAGLAQARLGDYRLSGGAGWPCCGNDADQ